MRKWIIILMALALLVFAGCQKQEKVEVAKSQEAGLEIEKNETENKPKVEVEQEKAETNKLPYVALPVISHGNEFYISVHDIVSKLNYGIEYVDNLYGMDYKDIIITDKKGRTTYIAGNVVYSSDGLYFGDPLSYEPVAYLEDDTFITVRNFAQINHLDYELDDEKTQVRFFVNNDEDVYPVFYILGIDEGEPRPEEAGFNIVWKDGHYLISNTNMTLSDYISELLEKYDFEDPIFETEEGLMGLFFIQFTDDRVIELSPDYS